VYYEINISRNGKHFFATNSRSVTTEKELNIILPVIENKFTAEEGYQIMVTCYETVGTFIKGGPNNDNTKK